MDAPRKEADQITDVSVIEEGTAVVSPPAHTIQTAVALSSIAESLSTVANFVSSGGLAQTIQSVVRAKGSTDLLSALIQHDGFDVRRLNQYATELPLAIEKLLEAYGGRLQDKFRTTEVKDAEVTQGFKPDVDKACPTPDGE